MASLRKTKQSNECNVASVAFPQGSWDHGAV